MGAQMNAGAAAIYTKRECWLVSDWCGRFDQADRTAEHFSDRIGVFDFPASVVARANSTIPSDFEAAQAAGFTVEDPGTFDRARAFLAAATADPDGITGSY